jgi:hypothetical protein
VFNWPRIITELAIAPRNPALHLAMLGFFVLGAVGKWAWM